MGRLLSRQATSRLVSRIWKKLITQSRLPLPRFFLSHSSFLSHSDLLTRWFVTQGTPRVFLTRTFLAPILIASAEFHLNPATSSFSAPSLSRSYFSCLGRPNAHDFIRSIDPFLLIGSNGTLSYVRKAATDLICEINYPRWILYRQDIVYGMHAPRSALILEKITYSRGWLISMKIRKYVIFRNFCIFSINIFN